MKRISHILLITIVALFTFMSYLDVQAEGKSRVQIINNVEYNGLGTYRMTGGTQDGNTDLNISHSEMIDKDTQVTVTATPGNRYIFRGWYNCEEYDTTGPANLGVMGWRPIPDEAPLTTNTTYTFTLTADFYNIMPVFETGHNNIWVSGDGLIAVDYDNSESEEQDGEHFKGGDMIEFVIGDSVTLIAKPNEGNHFVGWFITDENASSPDDYVREPVVSTSTSYTYQPKITTVSGYDEPLNYLTAVFEPNNNVDNEEYNLSDGENEISFESTAGRILVFSVREIMSLTDADAEAILEEMRQEAIDAGEEFDMTVDDLIAMRDYIIEKSQQAAGAYGTLLGIYEIEISDGGTEVHTVESKFNIKLKLIDGTEQYDNYMLVYLNDDYTPTETVNLTRNGNFVEGEINHLSNYIVVGYNNKNPDTSDSIIGCIIMLIICTAGCMIGLNTITKRKKLYKVKTR